MTLCPLDGNGSELMTQSWILEKKRQEHFAQQHVLLAPPAAQLLHCNCRQRITVRIQFLSLSFRFYISLETLLETLGSMLTVSRYAHLDWQYFMKWQSTKCGPSRLAEWGVALLVTGQDVSERAQLLPPSFPHFFFLPPLPADENFMALWKADFGDWTSQLL